MYRTHMLPASRGSTHSPRAPPTVEWRLEEGEGLVVSGQAVQRQGLEGGQEGQKGGAARRQGHLWQQRLHSTQQRHQQLHNQEPHRDGVRA